VVLEQLGFGRYKMPLKKDRPGHSMIVAIAIFLILLMAVNSSAHFSLLATFDGANHLNNNFTNILTLKGSGSISGYKINDTNGNGKWDEGEKGIKGWNINLIGKDKDKKNTEENDFYEFMDTPEEDDDLQDTYHSGSVVEYNSVENDGVEGWDVGKKIIPGWTVNLINKSGAAYIKYQTITDENGYYEFTNLPDSEYLAKRKNAEQLDAYKPNSQAY
jgi:hypothetical protein